MNTAPDSPDIKSSSAASAIASASTATIEEPSRPAVPLTLLWQELWASLRQPEFWALSSWMDIVVRQRKSRLGILWLLAPSLIYVVGLGLFFGGMQTRSFAEFSAHIALGFLVYRTLMSSVIESANVFTANQSFIMDGHMRLTDYLLEALAKSFFYFCAFLPVTIYVVAMYPGLQTQGFLWLPLTFSVIYLNALWISVVFSLVGTRFPDFSQFIGNISVFLFLLTPIVWYADAMPADSVQGRFMKLNPFYHYVAIFRAPLLGEPLEMGSIYFVTALTLGGLVAATVLYRRYSRSVPLWI